MDDGTPRESRYVYGEPATLTLPTGETVETIARCAHCGAPYVPSAHPEDRFCTPRCRDNAKGRRRRRENCSLLNLRRTLKAHGLLTPETRAALSVLRGVGRLPPAEAWARAGLTRPPIVRAPRRTPPATPPAVTPTPVTPAAPTEPDVTPDPWSLPSPQVECVGYALDLTVCPLPEVALSLRHTRALHGALSLALEEDHVQWGVAHFALAPSRGRLGWHPIFFARDRAARMRGTTHPITLPEPSSAQSPRRKRRRKSDTLHRTMTFGELVWRVQAPPPLAAGRYRVTVETLTPLCFTTCRRRTTIRTPQASTFTGGLRRVAEAVGVTVPDADLAFGAITHATEPVRVEVGGHVQRGTTERGVLLAIEGSLTVECNAVAAWLLQCAARIGLGGSTAYGFGRVHVSVARATDEATEPRARSVHAIPLSSLSPRTQERLG